VEHFAFGWGTDTGVWFNVFNAGSSTWSGWRFGEISKNPGSAIPFSSTVGGINETKQVDPGG